MSDWVSRVRFEETCSRLRETIGKLSAAQADLAARDAALLALAERAERPEERQHALQMSNEFIDGFDEGKTVIAEAIRKLVNSTNGATQ